MSEELSPLQDNTPMCLGPNTPISFDCIKLIVTALRGGSFNVMTLRMILLQIDRGLAMMAPTTSIDDMNVVNWQAASTLTVGQKLDRIEELLSNQDFPTTAGIKEELLRMLLDYLMDLLLDFLKR